MGWKDIPNMENASFADDTPWMERSSDTSRQKPAVHLLVDHHLCKQIEKMYGTIKEGYPTKIVDPSPLTMG